VTGATHTGPFGTNLFHAERAVVRALSLAEVSAR
jgi:hypothetical protein